MISPSELIRHPGQAALRGPATAAAAASATGSRGGTLTPPRSADDSDEYAAVELGASWSLLSLLAFGTALLSKPLVGQLPRELLRAVPWYWRAAVPPALSTLLFTAGLLFALLGLRQAKRRASGLAFARFALTLTSIGLALSLLFFFAFFTIMP